MKTHHSCVLAMALIVALAGCGGESHGTTDAASTQGGTSTPTDSPSTDDVWSLERIRAEGSTPDWDQGIATESGITTRAYVVCDGPRSKCENDASVRVPYQHAALEVTQDGRSALFSLGANLQHPTQAFDADSVFVIDDPDDAWGDPRLLRYRVLRADGTEVLLQLLDDPAPAVPGPGVFVIDFRPVGGGSCDGCADEAAYLVDLREGTLQPLDVPRLSSPREISPRYWGPNVDEFLWFVEPDCTVGWATDGTFEERRLDCAESRVYPAYVYDDGFPDGWLQPGRLALVERNDDRLFLHVSLDYGHTWQRIPVSDEDAIPETLQRLG